MTKSEQIRHELLKRIETLLAREPDHPKIPNSRFNKRLEFMELPNNGLILVRSKRRGGFVIDVWESAGHHQVAFANTPGHRKIIDVLLIERVVLPVLRQRMILDDLANA